LHTKPAFHSTPLWVYTVLPAVILNICAILLFGGYYGLQATQPELVANIQPDQVQFLVYIFVFSVEWVFSILLLKKQASKGITLTSLIAPDGQIWKFKWLPALTLFLVFNLVFIIYIPLVTLIYGQWPRLDNLLIWERLFLGLAVPLQAAFCEELIWRGHIIPELKARGKLDFAAITLSALSFALVHGIFLIDKLLLTFILGLVNGIYYLRERHPLPLMISHFSVDVWAFALSVF
jgi:membrane protease YdiL (CAAX protease family)